MSFAGVIKAVSMVTENLPSLRLSTKNFVIPAGLFKFALQIIPNHESYIYKLTDILDTTHFITAHLYGMFVVIFVVSKSDEL